MNRHGGLAVTVEPAILARKSSESTQCAKGCGTVLRFDTDHDGRLIEQCPQCDRGWRFTMPVRPEDRPKSGKRAYGELRATILTHVPVGVANAITSQELALKVGTRGDVMTSTLCCLIQQKKIDRVLGARDLNGRRPYRYFRAAA